MNFSVGVCQWDSNMFLETNEASSHRDLISVAKLSVDVYNVVRKSIRKRL